MSCQRINSKSNIFSIILSAFCIIVLTACTDSSNANPDPVQNISPAPSTGADTESPVLNDENSGKVIDGYIESAYICIDGNDNQICEKHEQLQVSNRQGRYLASKFNESLVIAQIIAGISKDEDDNGRTIKTSYLMYSANNNPKLITPLTTLAHFIQDSLTELTATEANRLLAETLSLSEHQLSQDYILVEDPQANKIAKILIISIQKILSTGLKNSENLSGTHYQLQAKAWEKLTLESLMQLNTIINAAENTDLDASTLSNSWLSALPQLFFTSTELGNSTDPTDPPEPTDTADLSVFKKISGTGEIISDSATNFQCVTQVKDSQGNDIASINQRTWMLLIPPSTTYKSLGFVPAGFTGNDKFWDYSWDLTKDTSLQPKFKEANGLIRQYSNDDNVEHFITLLNQNDYCGFSDWTVPTITSLKTLNTKNINKTSAIKTINTNIFKYYSSHVGQIKTRQDSNNDLLQPYFWTNNRSVNADGSMRAGMNDFAKYQHPSNELTSGENTAGGKLIDAQLLTTDTISGGQYHALRAVRYARYQRIDNAGQELNLTGTQWDCVKDAGPIDNRYTSPRYWSTLLAEDIEVSKSEISTILGDAISTSRCGFNNWRLPDADELIALKSLNSDQYFSAKNNDGSHKKISTFSREQDYYWLNTTSSTNDKIQLWSHNDILISSAGTPDHSANTLLINSKIIPIPANSDCADTNGKRYCAFHNAMSWLESKAECEANNLVLAKGSRLTDINTLATLLALDPGSSAYGYKAYWLANEWTGRDDYASTLRNNSIPANWEISATKMKFTRGFICSSDTSSTSDTTLPTPLAPSAGIVNDASNTFSWTHVAGFPQANEYEYSIDNATYWVTANTNPINIGNLSIPAGHFQLRVKALKDTNKSGTIFHSTEAYTTAVPNGNCSQGDAAANINGACYTRHDSALSWTAARDFCQANNTSLVTNAAAIVIASDLAAGLKLASSPTHYWLLDNELNRGRAQALTDYSGEWRAYNKDPRYPQRFICVK